MQFTLQPAFFTSVVSDFLLQVYKWQLHHVKLENALDLSKHIENIKNVYNLPVVVAINKFATDTEKEIEIINDKRAKEKKNYL